jgi:hypothetical protein
VGLLQAIGRRDSGVLLFSDFVFFTRTLPRDQMPGVEHSQAMSRIESLVDKSIVSGFAAFAVAGLGGLIYGFYSTCLLYYVKASVFYSAAVTSLR